MIGSVTRKCNKNRSSQALKSGGIVRNGAGMNALYYSSISCFFQRNSDKTNATHRAIGCYMTRGWIRWFSFLEPFFLFSSGLRALRVSAVNLLFFAPQRLCVYLSLRCLAASREVSWTLVAVCRSGPFVAIFWFREGEKTREVKSVLKERLSAHMVTFAYNA